MKALIRLPMDLLFWTGYILGLNIWLWLAGIPICWFLSKKKAWWERGSKYYRDEKGYPFWILAWKPKWAWLWGNEEDGIGGPQWWDDRVSGDLTKQVFLWSAWRNPVNNLRYVPVLHPKPDVKRIKWIGNSLDCHESLKARREDGLGYGKPFWLYAWQNAYAQFWIIWPLTKDRHFRLRIGWKVLPRDFLAGAVTDYRKIRYPFGLQFTLWRKG